METQPKESSSGEHKFYASFGYGQYGNQLVGHFLEVEAPNEKVAQAFMYANFGRKWSVIYSEETFEPGFFPKGAIPFAKARSLYVDFYGDLAANVT